MINTPEDGRKYAPATKKNRGPILEVLLQVLPESGTVLEVASGTGEHAVYFAPRLSPRRWLPTEKDPLLRASIRAWAARCPSDNLYPPLKLDARKARWTVEEDAAPDLPIVAIVNINMIYISPWSACLGLMAGAGRILPPGGILYLYGRFKQNGKHTAPSNAAFDQSLRVHNPTWGVRNLQAVIAAARDQHLNFIATYPMPANHLSVVFDRS